LSKKQIKTDDFNFIIPFRILVNISDILTTFLMMF